MVKLSDEPPEHGRPVNLGQSKSGLRIVAIPGIGGSCFKRFLDPKITSITHVAKFGYDFTLFEVDALSDSRRNAKQIRDLIMGMPDQDDDKPLALLGYSKWDPGHPRSDRSLPGAADQGRGRHLGRGRSGWIATGERCVRIDGGPLAILPRRRV
ncbi:MAG: hypothetical protein LJE91_04465 [Gammaproteobacteria bacterium]|nr:hypothetical protein [Gammaproteobacteria bacterium]